MILKILKWGALALAVIALVFVGIVAMQPDDYRVTRSTTIAAPPEPVFVHINDFHKWDAWSPWAKLDPNAKNSFEGPASGKGAVFRWAGNQEVGEGSMTITESQPHERVRIRLDFVKPFEDTSTVEFTLRPEAAQTQVTWDMSGRHIFISKAMCLFMSMDQMIGGKFEEGLASLKTAVESAAKK